MSKIVYSRNNFKEDLYAQKVLIGGSSDGFSWAGKISQNEANQVFGLDLTVFNGKEPKIGDKLKFQDPDFKTEVTITAVSNFQDDNETVGAKSATINVSVPISPNTTTLLTTGTRAGEKYTRFASCTSTNSLIPSNTSFNADQYGEFNEGDVVIYGGYGEDDEIEYGTATLSNIDIGEGTLFEFDPPLENSYLYIVLFDTTQDFNFQKYLLRRRK